MFLGVPTDIRRIPKKEVGHEDQALRLFGIASIYCKYSGACATSHRECRSGSGRFERARGAAAPGDPLRQLRQAYNDFLNQCRKDGTYIRLIQKYYPDAVYLFTTSYLSQRNLQSTGEARFAVEIEHQARSVSFFMVDTEGRRLVDGRDIVDDAQPSDEWLALIDTEPRVFHPAYYDNEMVVVSVPVHFKNAHVAQVVAW